jgi:hypothetical protein
MTKIPSSLPPMSSLLQSYPYIELCQKVDRIEPMDPSFLPSLTFVIFSSNYISPPVLENLNDKFKSLHHTELLLSTAFS